MNLYIFVETIVFRFGTRLKSSLTLRKCSLLHSLNMKVLFEKEEKGKNNRFINVNYDKYEN